MAFRSKKLEEKLCELISNYIMMFKLPMLQLDSILNYGFTVVNMGWSGSNDAIRSTLEYMLEEYLFKEGTYTIIRASPTSPPTLLSIHELSATSKNSNEALSKLVMLIRLLTNEKHYVLKYQANILVLLK